MSGKLYKILSQEEEQDDIILLDKFNEEGKKAELNGHLGMKNRIAGFEFGSNDQIFLVLNKKIVLIVSAIVLSVILGLIVLHFVQMSNEKPSDIYMEELNQYPAEWPDVAMEGVLINKFMMESLQNLLKNSTQSEKTFLQDGQMKIGDVVLKNFKCTGSWSLFPGKQTVKVKGNIINSIICFDFSYAGMADFEIVEGGVGQNFVVLEVIPQPLRGYNVSVVVTGVL